MVFENDELLISSRSEKLLKSYLGFIIADIIGILFIQNVFVDFDIYVYTFIRAVCISFSIAIYMLKQVIVIGKMLGAEYKYIFNEVDTKACDEDGGVTDEQWTEIKKVLKMLGAEYKYIFNEVDTKACDEDDGVTDEQWTETKKVLKIILAIIETGALFGAQAMAIVHFRESFFDDSAIRIVICLVMMGTLTYLSRNYLNKKYCI